MCCSLRTVPRTPNTSQGLTPSSLDKQTRRRVAASWVNIAAAGNHIVAQTLSYYRQSRRLASVRFTTSVRTTIGYCWRVWRLKQYPAMQDTGDIHRCRAAQTKAGTLDLFLICRVAVASRSSPLSGGSGVIHGSWGRPTWNESGDTGRGRVSERGGCIACGLKARRRRSQYIQWRERERKRVVSRPPVPTIYWQRRWIIELSFDLDTILIGDVV